MTPEIQKKNRLMLADYLENQVEDRQYNHAHYWHKGKGCALGHAAKSGLFGITISNGSICENGFLVIGSEVATKMFGAGSYIRIFESLKKFSRLDAIKALREF